MGVFRNDSGRMKSGQIWEEMGKSGSFVLIAIFILDPSPPPPNFFHLIPPILTPLETLTKPLEIPPKPPQNHEKPHENPQKHSVPYFRIFI